ncbi:hypothetical protein PPYR_01377 [Photinus pyralis]|uniref:THAP-type domain-containing protein n=1 Tax=Photinus pyralis TaxID=7054 RepID=A0A5N4B468_PHOPY|nr:hypothetical protein PPYR_01377 [Photinus pyralis]
MMDANTVKYKNKCCVPGCDDKVLKRHRFPKDLNLLRKWIENIKVPHLMALQPHQVYDTKFVCQKHFAPEYVVPGTRRGLRRDAVPTLHILGNVVVESAVPTRNLFEDTENDPMEVTATTTVPTRNVFEATENVPMEVTATTTVPTRNAFEATENVPMEVTATTTVPISSSIKKPQDIKKKKRILQAVNVTRQIQLTPNCQTFYKMVTQLNTKAAKFHIQRESYRKRLMHAEAVAKNPNFANFADVINETTYKFILQQLRNQSLPPKARRYTIDDKLLALTVLKSSSKGYKILSKIFSLPSKHTLLNMLNKVPFRPGVNKQIFASLKDVVQKLSINERKCALVFDEMSISPSLSYNIRADCYDGVEDFGKERFPHLADHANVFMVKGVYRQWKQALSFTFSNGPVKSLQLKKMIVEIIKECHNIGFEVVATICDQGSANSSAVNLLIKETNEHLLKNGIENKYIGFLVDNKEIVPLYDVPHLFKGIRNNLLLKNLHFTMNDVEHVAKWEHIEQLYFLDTAEDTRLLPKLTDRHVIGKKINKMKVAYMTQLFSHAVGAHLQRFAGWDTRTPHNLPLEATQTGTFILFMDKLFDSLNGNNKIAPLSKPLKGGLTMTSDHEQFWRDAIRVLENAKFFDSQKKIFCKVPSILNLVKTLKAFIYLKKVLLINKMQYILPRALNQDCLENFFASMRSHGRRNISPDARHFITSFKALIVNNFMSSHSPSSNCEDDFTVGALDNLRSFITGEEVPGICLLENNFTIETSFIVSHSKKRPIAKATLAYVAGYVGNRISKSANCSVCKDMLTTSYGNVPMDVIEAREYSNSRLFRPGTYLYLVISQACSRLFYLIPRHCHKYGLNRSLIAFIMETINFDFLKCEKHTDLGLHVVKLIVKVIFYFWGKQVNKILNGNDERFVRLLATKPNMTTIDAIKLEAHRKYLSKLKNKKKYSI